MAIRVIYSFQEGNQVYNIRIQDGTGAILSPFIYTADFDAYTKPLVGDYLASQCVGFDNYIYTFVDGQGFAEYTIEDNSSACGYNPDNPSEPLQVSNLVSTNETSYNAKDGTVEITVTGGTAPYLITLDNSNYNLLPAIITGLAPGSYVFIIQDQNGLQTFGNFNINSVAPIIGCTDPNALNYDPSAQVDNGTCIYPNPDVADDSRGNLYETIDQFRLIDSTGTTHLIEMPRGWEKIIFKLERDPKYHGVNNEFTDGDIQLDFDAAAGRDILLEEYGKNGNDGFMRFQFGAVYPDGTFIPDVDGFIDFNVKNKDRDFFSASVKSKRFDDSIETKNEIDVTIKDGYFNMPLHSKEIQKKIIVNRTFKSSQLDTLGNSVFDDPNPNGSGPSVPGDAPFMVYWNFLDFSAPAEGESGFSSFVNDLAPNPPLFGTTQSSPVPTSQYWFVTDGGGVFTFNIAFSLKLKGKVLAPLINDSRFGYFSYKWFLVHNTNYYELPGSINGFTNSRFQDFNFSTNYNKVLTLSQGDKVYLFGQLVFEKINTPGGFQAQIDLNFMNVNVSGDTLSLPTTAYSKLSHEVCQDILTSISNGQAKLKSNLLGRTDLGYEENGCAALIAYTNGYLIRNFPLADRPLIINLKDFIEGLDALYAIGMGYELNDLNEWVYRIEHFEYFYKDVLIMTFDNVSDYKEPIDTSMIYNKISFGFTKYTQDLESVSTIDEFLTRHDYLMPIKSYKAELIKLCKQVAAGYAIELAKRKQYSVDKQTSYAYDEDNFIISTVPSQQYGYVPEKLENFTASGILSPETAYNIRFTITRMIARWAKWINSGLAYKNNSAVLDNTFTAKNGDLTSQYTGDQACESKKQFTEAQDLFKGDLANGEQSFFPDTIEFKTKVSWDDIRAIRRCFMNKDTLGRNNGYFGVVDGDGVTQYGYLMSLQYNPLNELATFVLRKKYVDLNEPFDCSTYTFYTFEDFEQATGLPSEIEQCLFENFA